MVYEENPIPDCHGQYNDKTKYCHDNCYHKDTCKNKTLANYVSKRLLEIGK